MGGRLAIWMRVGTITVKEAITWAAKLSDGSAKVSGAGFPPTLLSSGKVTTTGGAFGIITGLGETVMNVTVAALEATPFWVNVYWKV